MVALRLADGVDGELLCERQDGEVVVKGVVRPSSGRAPGRSDWLVGQLPGNCRPPYRISSHSVARRDGQPFPCKADITPDGEVSVYVPLDDADSVHLMARIWLTA